LIEYKYFEKHPAYVHACNELVGSVVVADTKLDEQEVLVAPGSLTSTPTFEHLRYADWGEQHLLKDPGRKNAADECVIVVVEECYGIGTGASSMEHDNGAGRLSVSTSPEDQYKFCSTSTSTACSERNLKNDSLPGYFEKAGGSENVSQSCLVRTLPITEQS
jgi:hypothetical protein